MIHKGGQCVCGKTHGALHRVMRAYRGFAWYRRWILRFRLIYWLTKQRLWSIDWPTG